MHISVQKPQSVGELSLFHKWYHKMKIDLLEVDLNDKISSGDLDVSFEELTDNKKLSEKN